MVMGITSFKQIKDINGVVGSVTNGRPISNINQFFTLTASDITQVTVPSTTADGYAAVITVTQGADVFVSPVATSVQSLALPAGTVATTLGQLVNGQFETTFTPGQTLQFIYANTNVADQTVTVHIAYYALSPNSFLG